MIGVVGSVAAQIHGVNFGRNPGDYDLVGDYDELVSFVKKCFVTSIVPFDEGKKLVAKNKHQIYECEIAWIGSLSDELFTLIMEDPDSTTMGAFVYASKDILYMLKMTHRYRKNSPHFLKTMSDIHLLRAAGAAIKDSHQDFYRRRLKETLNYQHPKLNQNKKQFFTDDVPYVYDHDTIHLAVALYGQPAYTFFKEDQAEVKVSKDMFFKLDYNKQIAAVYEESCVLALERSQIPYPETDKRKSFEMALMKVCTSITSGWFREFAWENYHKVIELYDLRTEVGMNYTIMFQYGLDCGLIKPYKE